MGKITLVAALAALCGCAGLRGQSQPPAERLGVNGVGAPVVTVEGGSVLRFVNDDVRPHQIYSNDCSELSSTVLNPGDTHEAGIRGGARWCHFQDLLAPLSSAYSGVVQVLDEEKERRLADQE